jgi:hypothetical protein
VLVRAEQHELSFIEASRLFVSHVDHIERDSAFFGRPLEGRHFHIRETQQRESAAEPIEERSAVFEEDARCAHAGPRRGYVAIPFVGRRDPVFVADDGRVVVAIPDLDAEGLVLEVAELHDLLAQRGARGFASRRVLVNAGRAGPCDLHAHRHVSGRGAPVANADRAALAPIGGE